MTERKFLDRYVWWHRVRGHEVASSGAFDMFGNTSTGCLTCDCGWRNYLSMAGNIVVFDPGPLS